MLVADNVFELVLMFIIGLYFVCMGSHYIFHRIKEHPIIGKHENFIFGLISVGIGLYFLLMFVFGVKLTMYL